MKIVKLEGSVKFLNIEGKEVKIVDNKIDENKIVKIISDSKHSLLHIDDDGVSILIEGEFSVDIDSLDEFIVEEEINEEDENEENVIDDNVEKEDENEDDELDLDVENDNKTDTLFINETLSEDDTKKVLNLEESDSFFVNDISTNLENFDTANVLFMLKDAEKRGALENLKNGTLTSEREFLVLGDIDREGISISTINNSIQNSSLSFGDNDAIGNLNKLIDTLVKLRTIDGNSSGLDLSADELAILGLDGSHSADKIDAINDVIRDPDSISLSTTGGGIVSNLRSIEDTISKLNSKNGDANSSDLNSNDLSILGVKATNDSSFSSDELEYINNRIAENSKISKGDGDYKNDVAQLQNLINEIDGKTIEIGTTNDDSWNYVVDRLYDGLGESGSDVINVKSGISVNLSNIHNIEKIVLDSDNGTNNTTLGSSSDKINVQDVIDITDKGNTLTIDNGDSDNDTIEKVYVDTTEFINNSNSGGYNIYDNGNGVVLKIEDTIIVD